jgi:ABC-type branched-subunit amino acid transport system ATPase component
MVLVEQNIAFGLSLVDTAHLLQTGVVVHTAPVSELDDDTLATHLGIGKVLAGATGSALSARKGSKR